MIDESSDQDRIWSQSKIAKLRIVESDQFNTTYPGEQPNIAVMRSITREEFDAKIETIEVRMDGRVSEILAKIELHIARMDDRELANKDRAASISDTLKDIKTEVRSFRTTIIATTISVGVATVLGIAAFNATVLSNMIASFESGKNTATAIGDASKRLESIQDKLDAQQKRAFATPATK